jgi:archaellum biogenesis protein FlaJ (TadC family)
VNSCLHNKEKEKIKILNLYCVSVILPTFVVNSASVHAVTGVTALVDMFYSWQLVASDPALAPLQF